MSRRQIRSRLCVRRPRNTVRRWIGCLVVVLKMEALVRMCTSTATVRVGPVRSPGDRIDVRPLEADDGSFRTEASRPPVQVAGGVTSHEQTLLPFVRCVPQALLPGGRQSLSTKNVISTMEVVDLDQIDGFRRRLTEACVR